MSFEELRVYQAAKLLRAEVDKLRKSLDPTFLSEFLHVDESVDSILNNIAEGSGSIYPKKAASYYDIAEGSSREARNGLKSLDERGAFGGASIFRSVVLSLAVSKMLRKMIRGLTDRP